ncbi:MAG: hypothetical protein ACYCXQ_06120 [Candidatus Humimicrobiaceae bacterium]
MKQVEIIKITQYILKGIIHPERAHLTIGSPIKFPKTIHISSQKELCIELNIVLNHVTIWIETIEEWNIYDLRNIGRYLTNTVCSILTFINGYYYEVEIIQILSKEKGIDWVFGIDTPCISKRNSIEELKEKFDVILKIIITGEVGIYLQRCFRDLNLALKDTEDTAFYCYRAIESLKQYCKVKFNISKENKQWKKVSEICGYEQDYIKNIKDNANNLRHGGYASHTDKERAEFLTKTWNVIEGFVKNIL